MELKPPYRVPTLEEIRNLTWNGRTVASLFSGAGGSSLGYRMAGYRVAYANEFIEEAGKTYRANCADYTYLDNRNVREVTGDSIRELGKFKELDLLDGSPPCASFSTAGAGARHWGKVKKYSDSEERTDDLFFEYIRLVDQLRPKVFIAENVSGLVKGKAKGYFIEIFAKLEALGYRVNCRLLDAQWLGVPQTRQRVFIVGVRKDLGRDPVFPSPFTYRYSVGEALEGITVSEEEKKVLNFERYSLYNAWLETIPGTSSERYFSLTRSHREKPTATIMASIGSSPGTAGVTHWDEPRKFSIAELKRICSFPDDFILTGNNKQQAERLGRSVPPLMMKALSSEIFKGVFRENP